MNRKEELIQLAIDSVPDMKANGDDPEEMLCIAESLMANIFLFADSVGHDPWTSVERAMAHYQEERES